MPSVYLDVDLCEFEEEDLVEELEERGYQVSSKDQRTRHLETIEKAIDVLGGNGLPPVLLGLLTRWAQGAFSLTEERTMAHLLEVA